MEWFANALWAKLGWAAGELLIGVVVIACIGALSLPRLFRQSRCKHPRYFETGSCNAVCSDCGKNLGFIGAWREKSRT